VCEQEHDGRACHESRTNLTDDGHLDARLKERTELALCTLRIRQGINSAYLKLLAHQARKCVAAARPTEHDSGRMREWVITTHLHLKLGAAR
jgi:hypothetical protein